MGNVEKGKEEEEAVREDSHFQPTKKSNILSLSASSLWPILKFSLP
jgi:hypothetical protein